MSVEITKGDFVAIIGASDSGKSIRVTNDLKLAEYAHATVKLRDG